MKVYGGVIVDGNAHERGEIYEINSRVGSLRFKNIFKAC